MVKMDKSPGFHTNGHTHPNTATPPATRLLASECLLRCTGHNTNSCFLCGGISQSENQTCNHPENGEDASKPHPTASRLLVACEMCGRKESMPIKSALPLLHTITSSAWFLLAYLSVILAMPTTSPWAQWLITLPLSIGTCWLLTVCVSRLESL